jgi:hypothetical protein
MYACVTDSLGSIVHRSAAVLSARRLYGRRRPVLVAGECTSRPQKPDTRHLVALLHALPATRGRLAQPSPPPPQTEGQVAPAGRRTWSRRGRFSHLSVRAFVSVERGRLLTRAQSRTPGMGSPRSLLLPAGCWCLSYRSGCPRLTAWPACRGARAESSPSYCRAGTSRRGLRRG